MKHKITYRGYELWPSSDAGSNSWSYCHIEYDGSPDEPIDNRWGHAIGVLGCVECIDELEDE